MYVRDGVICFAWYFDVIVDCCVDIDFDVVAGECFLSSEVDDVGFHVDDVYFISEGVEVL